MNSFLRNLLETSQKSIEFISESRQFSVRILANVVEFISKSHSFLRSKNVKREECVLL